MDQKAKKLRLSKIGTVKVHLSRAIEGKIKTCTIKREADGWYVIFAVEEPEKTITLAPEESVGVDVGLKTFAALSTGEQIENPRFLRRSEAELKTAQRRVSRRRRGSRRRKNAIGLLAKRHQKVRRQRLDFHHKEARKLVNRFRVVKFENLNIKGMVRNHRLAKGINDAGWNQFIMITASKAEEAGGVALKVNPSGTSTRCSRCGDHHRMPLHIRAYRCSKCGLIIDRDHNSGINIKEREGRAVLSRRQRVAVVEEAITYQPTELESPATTRSV